MMTTERDQPPSDALPARPADSGPGVDEIGQTMQVLSNEQNALTAALGMTVDEMNNRVSLFFTVLSATAVSVSFVSQLTGSGEGFYYFVFIMLVIVMMIGLASYIRLVELSIQSFVCIRGMNRIRHYYAQISPTAADHFVQSPHDDYAGVATTIGITPHPRQQRRSWWTGFYTSSGLVALMVGLVGGIAVNLLSWAWGYRDPLALGLELLVSIGVILVVLIRYEASSWRRLEQRSVAKFPHEAAPMLGRKV